MAAARLLSGLRGRARDAAGLPRPQPARPCRPTCWGRPRSGVRNIVCMTGDDVSAGDHPETKPIYDIDSVHLIRMARIMRDEGTYLSGRAAHDGAELPDRRGREPVRAAARVPADAAGHEDRGGGRVRPDADLLQPREASAVHGAVRRARAARPRVGAGGGVRAAFREGRRYLRDQVPGSTCPRTSSSGWRGRPASAQWEKGIRLALEIVEQVRADPGRARASTS